MRMSLKTLLAVAVVLATGSACMAEQIDNPQYKSWAKFKEGTSVTIHTSSEMAGNKTEMDTTTTLKAISADKATVETKMSMVVAGNKMDMPPQSTDVPAKVEKPAAPTGDAPKADVKEGTDTVDVGGKSISCKTTETTTTSNGMNIASKSWTSEDVPGSLVKVESTTTGSMSGTTKMAVTALDIK